MLTCCTQQRKARPEYLRRTKVSSRLAASSCSIGQQKRHTFNYFKPRIPVYNFWLLLCLVQCLTVKTKTVSSQSKQYCNEVWWVWISLLSSPQCIFLCRLLFATGIVADREGESQVRVEESGEGKGSVNVCLKHLLERECGSHILQISCTLWVYNCAGLPLALQQSIEEDQSLTMVSPHKSIFLLPHMFQNPHCLACSALEASWLYLNALHPLLKLSLSVLCIF